MSTMALNPTQHFPEYYSVILSRLVGQTGALAVSSFTILEQMYQFFQGLTELVDCKTLQRKLAIEWISRLLMFFTEETYLYYKKNGNDLGIIATGHVLNLCNRICGHFSKDSIFVMGIAAMRASMQFKISDFLSEPTFESLEGFFSSVDFWFRMHNFKISQEDVHIVPQFITGMIHTPESRQLARMVVINPIHFILPVTERICRESDIKTLEETAQSLENLFWFFSEHYVDKTQYVDRPIFPCVPDLVLTPIMLLCNRLHFVFVKMNRLLRLHTGYVMVFYDQNELYLVSLRDQVEAEKFRLLSRNAIKRLAAPPKKACRSRVRRASVKKVEEPATVPVTDPITSPAGDAADIEEILGSPEMTQIFVDIVLQDCGSLTEEFSLPEPLTRGLEEESPQDSTPTSLTDPLWSNGHEASLELLELLPTGWEEHDGAMAQSSHNFDDVFFDFANW